MKRRVNTLSFNEHSKIHLSRIADKLELLTNQENQFEAGYKLGYLEKELDTILAAKKEKVG